MLLNITELRFVKISVYSRIFPLEGNQKCKGVTTEKSTILSCLVQLELRAKKKVITTLSLKGMMLIEI